MIARQLIHYLLTGILIAGIHTQLLSTPPRGVEKKTPPREKDSKKRPDSDKKEKKNEDSIYNASLISGLKFRSIGPAFCSGRIADFAVNPKNHSEWYVAVASGHLWKTTNNGTTFDPIFDHYGV